MKSFFFLLKFQIKYLRLNYPNLKYIAVDGGVNNLTGGLAAAAGANVLIAGSAIFGKNRCREKSCESGSDGNGAIYRNYKILMETLLLNSIQSTV